MSLTCIVCWASILSPISPSPSIAVVHRNVNVMVKLDKIIEITGRPSAEDIVAIKSPFAATMLESLPPSRPKTLTELFPNGSAEALDLIRTMLQFNPEKRCSVDEALRHPYLAQFHDPDNEAVAARPVRIVIDDNTKYSAADYRERLYREIAKKKKEARRSRKQGQGQLPQQAQVH